MYADPSLVRLTTRKFYVNEHESALIDELVKKTGQQRSVLLRDLVMQSIERALAAQSADSHA
jgi:hypothetical protein